MNLSAPDPVTNRELSKALGRVLRRPAFAPVPGLAVKALYGEMAIDRHDRACGWCRPGCSSWATRSGGRTSRTRCAGTGR